MSASDDLMPNPRHKSKDRPRSVPQSESARPDGAGTPARLRQTPIEDLEPAFEIEFPEAGSALDAQLRREQTKAIFDLLIAYRRGHPG
jgi:hypothetical protein